MASWLSRLFRRGQAARAPKAATGPSSLTPATGPNPQSASDSGQSPPQGDSLEDDLVVMRRALQAQGFPEEAIEGMCRQLEEEVIAMAKRQARKNHSGRPDNPSPDSNDDATPSSKDTQHEQPDP